MQIKQIQATATSTYREFRCVNSYGEWQLFRTRLIGDEWETYFNRAMERIVIGKFPSLRASLEAAHTYANRYN
jgi:hypothetical protein